MPDITPSRSAIKAIRRSVRLAPFTTWNIGGYADFFVEPRSVAEVEVLAEYARSAGMRLTILGRGSNVLVDDAGIDGLVICTRMLHDEPAMGDDTITVLAGHPLPRLAVSAARAGREGLEFLIGIPGTVGAGVAINAGLGGTDGIAMDSALLEVKLLDVASGTVWAEPARLLELSYRHSNIPERGLWVLEATLAAPVAGEPEAPARRQREILGRRKAKQPLQKHTSGSVFRQPVGGKSAGWYIDQADLKGLVVGGAMVSPIHANWIENDGTATAQDVRDVVDLVVETVQREYALQLEREVVYLGRSS